MTDAALVQIDDTNRVRTLTLNRPDALNAFSEALYDATTIALKDAAADPEVSVVLLTGAGRAFSAGNDLVEMQEMVTNPEYQMGEYGFPGLIEALTAFPKPLICAVNGVGLGIGTTILGYAIWRSCRRRRGSSAPSPASVWPRRRRRRTCCRGSWGGRTPPGCCCPRSG